MAVSRRAPKRREKTLCFCLFFLSKDISLFVLPAIRLSAQREKAQRPCSLRLLHKKSPILRENGLEAKRCLILIRREKTCSFAKSGTVKILPSLDMPRVYSRSATS